MRQASSHEEILAKVHALYAELTAHEGFGELRIEVRLLRRGQREVILHCGKQYRYVVDDLPMASRGVGATAKG